MYEATCTTNETTKVITQFYNEFSLWFHALWLISSLNNVTNFFKSFTHIFYKHKTSVIDCAGAGYFKYVDLNSENQWINWAVSSSTTHPPALFEHELLVSMLAHRAGKTIERIYGTYMCDGSIQYSKCFRSSAVQTWSELNAT